MDAEAHITGTVWKVKVVIGQTVRTGDPLVILESMKMEIPVEAPCDGVISAICVREGEAVMEGNPVARITVTA